MAFYKMKILILTLIGLSVVGSAASSAELKMSYNSDWPPYSYGVGSEIQGILPRLMTEIVDKRMGMKISHFGYPWKRAQREIETGNLDAMVTVPTKSRLAYATTSTNTVYTIEMRPIVATGSVAESKISATPTPETLKGYRICEILGNGWGKQFAEKNNLHPVMASKVSSCLRMTANGRTDVIVQPVAVANQEIAAENLSDKLTIIPTPVGTMKFTLLLSKKSILSTNFMEKFDKVLNEMIKDGSYSVLIDQLRSGRSK